MVKKITTLIFIVSFINSIFSQKKYISFTDMLAFKNKADFPADVFSYFQKNGFDYVKKLNYSEIVGGTAFDLSKCNKHYYGKQNCTAIISFCDNIKTIPLEEYAIDITIGFGTSENYDDLIQKIKTNCTYLKTTEAEYNGFPTKSFHYKHKSGVTFVYKKYIATDNKVEYYVSIEIP